MIAPSLPSLKDLSSCIAIDGLTGCLYGILSQTNFKLTTTIFAIRALTHTLFYHIANSVLQGKDLQSQKIFLVTSTIVNMTFLFVLRELNLIGQLFSCLLGATIIGHLTYRLNYIQDQEKQQLLEEQIE